MTKAKPTTPAKGIKRHRSKSTSPPPITSSQDIPSQSSLATPSRAPKKAKVQKTSSQKAEESATKAAKAEAAQTDKARKANEKQWKQDWKDWFNAPTNKANATFQRSQDDDLVNVKEAGNVYWIKREELSCLPHCNAPNPHGAYFTPMKLFMKSAVQNLAFRKEAILAGVAQDNEVEFLRRGKELYEEKHGPTDELYVSRMGNAEPAKDRKPDVKSISGYHWRLIRDLNAGNLFDDRVLDALEELDAAGLRHMVR